MPDKTEYTLRDSFYSSFSKCKLTYSDRNKISGCQGTEWEGLQSSKRILLRVRDRCITLTLNVQLIGCQFYLNGAIF